MDQIIALSLSLRGFSSDLFGKTAQDAEIRDKIKNQKYSYRSSPIFYVRQTPKSNSGISIRKFLQWFADLSSQIHFCRLWFETIKNNIDVPFATAFQDLMISLDQDLTELERKLQFRVSDPAYHSGYSILKLFQTFRTYSPLFSSMVKMIETFLSDARYRKKLLLKKKKTEMQHFHFGSVGILTEYEVLQRKSYLAFDIDGQLINRNAMRKKYQVLSSSNSHISLRLSLQSPHLPFFCLFMKNTFPSWMQFVLNYVFQFTKQNSTKSLRENLVNDSVNFLSKWTPDQLMLHHIIIILEFCKVDFEILDRFRNAPKLKENQDAFHTTGQQQMNFSELLRSLDKLINGASSTYLNQKDHQETTLTRYLKTGKMTTTDVKNDRFHYHAYIDQHLEQREAHFRRSRHKQVFQKLDKLIRFVLDHQLESTSEKRISTPTFNSNQQTALSGHLWKHSANLYPPKLFQKLIDLFDEVNMVYRPENFDSLVQERDEVHKKQISSKSCSSHSFVHPSENVRRSIFSPICEQLRMVKDAAYQILDRDFHLRHQLDFIRSVFLLGQIDILQSFKDLVLRFPLYVSSESEMSAIVASAQQNLYQNQVQWQSLSFVLESAILEQKPPKGIQHFSVLIPTLQEAQRLRSNDQLHGDRKREATLDESLLGCLIKHMTYEVHYQWPVSLLFPSSVVQRFQHIFQTLLSMITLKWLSEAWWKAIIPKGGLFRMDSRSKRTSVLQEDEDRLRQAQRNCQQAFIQVMHLAQLLSGYYLSRIHERIWPDVMGKCCKSNINHEKVGSNSTDGAELPVTIEIVQASIRDGLELIEDLLMIIQEPFTRLVECSFKAFNELRQALIVEQNFKTMFNHEADGYQVIQDKIGLKKAVKNGSSIPHEEKISRMLVAYRMAEIAFEDVNQARESLMLAILSWRATNSSLASSSNGSAVKASKKSLAKTPQSAWKMQQIQNDARISSERLGRKRLFTDEDPDMDKDCSFNDDVDADNLQRAHSIEFLRFVEELQTQCAMLWTE